MRHTVRVVTREALSLVEHSADDFAAFGTLVRQTLFHADLDRETEASFAGRVRLLDCDDISFVDLASGAHGMHLAPAQVAPDERRHVVVCLKLAGQTEVRQHGRTMMLGAGDFTVYDPRGAVEALTVTPNLRALNIKVGVGALGLPMERIEDLVCTTIPTTEGLPYAVSAFLRHFISSTVLSNATSALPGRRQAIRQAARHSMMLIRTMLVDELVARGAGADCVVLQQQDAINAFIDDNLGDSELTPASIARAHFVSLRQLHRLFEDSGETVAARIRSRRLERCRDDLSDPLQRSMPVGAIGLRWGFRSPSQFGATFKEATGMTPNEFRAAALDG